MKLYETQDGRGGWTGTYKVERRDGHQGQWLWVPVKRFLCFWIKDRSRRKFWDWPSLFREKRLR